MTDNFTPLTKEDNRDNFLSLVGISLLAIFLSLFSGREMAGKLALRNAKKPEIAVIKEKGSEILMNKTDFVVNGNFRESAGQLLDKIVSSPPSGWNVYKVSSSLQDPKFKLEEDKNVLLGVDSALLITSSDRGVGLVQQLPDKVEAPLILRTKLLVTSGRVHFSLVDEKEREVYAAEVKAENQWQDFSAEILSLDFEGERTRLKEVRLYSADPNTSWYTSTVSLANFDPQQVKTSSEGSFIPKLPPYNLRVLFIALNPVENGENLVDHFNLGWGMSALQIEDTLANNIISDFQQLSGGSINYQVVKKLNISTFPPYLNGLAYDFAKYSQCLAGDPDGGCEYQKSQLDHIGWVRDNRICQTADEEQIDAIWLIAPVYLTAWEDIYIGPGTEFGVGGGAFLIPECQKHYVIPTSNYRGDPSNLHISHVYGHMIEGMMRKVSLKWSPNNRDRYWTDFTQREFLYRQPYDVDVGPFPQLFCGNIHWPSNGRRHYDYWNYAYKDFSCPDWKNFPALKGEKEYVNCERWGCGEGGLWETYWLSTLPDYWWSFLLWPDEILRYINAGAPIPPAPTSTPTPVAIGPAHESRCGEQCKPGYFCRCEAQPRKEETGRGGCFCVKNL